MEAVFDFLHLLLHFRGELFICRGTAKHQGHTGAGVDFYSCRAGHTIAAGPAEFSAEHFLIPLDHGFYLRSHLGRVIYIGDKFIQLRFLLNASDRQHIVVSAYIGLCV